MSGYRKITVDGQVYRYKVGRGAVKVDGMPHVDFSRLTGWSWNDIERGTWKRYFSITPRHVRQFILSQRRVAR